jgi:hypothetical protein
VISRRRVVIVLLAAFMLVAVLWNSAGIAQARPTAGKFFLQATAIPATPTAPQPTSSISTPPAVNMSIGNDTCLNCHGKPGLSMKTQDGQVFGLYVPADHYNASIHGSKGYACVQCHTTVGNYPHPPFQAADARDATLKLNQVCQRCHSYEFENALDSVHAQAWRQGKREAAICTDCHTAHDVQQITYPGTGELLPEARVWSAQICARCHNSIYQTYAQSVHGSALIGEGNPDVPTCIDCHGVHNIANPETAAFRTDSPLICAKCHANEQLMKKYNISTQVFNTYVDDFHGTTVTLFEKQSPGTQTNKATCYDCHGSHDISRTDDPHTGLKIESNLLARCQQCHPDASANFPTAWLSHYIPTWQTFPLLMSIQWFYRILIPAVLGGMAILVALDARALIRHRKRKSRQLAHAIAPEAAASAQSAIRAQTSEEPQAVSEAEQAVEAEPPVEVGPVSTPETASVETAAVPELEPSEAQAEPLASEVPPPSEEAVPAEDRPSDADITPSEEHPSPEDSLPEEGGQDEANPSPEH